MTHYTGNRFYTNLAANLCPIFKNHSWKSKNINTMKGDTLQRNNTGFLSRTDSPYYLEMTTFTALINHFD